MHILTAEQFTPEQLDQIFTAAIEMEALDQGLDSRRELATRHVGRQLGSVFYEPSLRTRFGFEIAAVKLGMGVVSSENAGEFSSAVKGETLVDTIRVLNGYNIDAITLRHPDRGSAAKAAAVSEIPIINGGDGDGEHPSQGVLDLFTIDREFERLNNLVVVMGGDLRNGRTVRTLAQMLSKNILVTKYDSFLSQSLE